MANLLAVHSVGASLVALLRNAYPDALRARHACEFRLLSSGELATEADLVTTLSLYLYRVTANEHLRTSPRPVDPADARPPLAVDLHYLLTVWADSALAEHVILGYAMRELHARPVLDVASLSPEGGWGPGEVVQIIPAELSNEDMMRLWDALEPAYRLSVSYIARVVRIDHDPVPTGRPVIATRTTYTDRPASR